MVNSTNLGLDNSKRIVGEEPKKKGRAIKTEVKPSRLTDAELQEAKRKHLEKAEAMIWGYLCETYR